MADWSKITSRGNIDDRRGAGPTAVGGVGLAGVVIYALFSYFSTGTVDVGTVLNQLQTTQVQQQTIDTKAFDGADSYEVFASTVLGSTNDMWSSLFNKSNKTYTPPELVLFRGSTDSACGGATSDIGPHYCSGDSTIYLDETFFDELQTRFHASGDVAQAYVIAHEVGHHIQHELQIENSDSIHNELQADCFAGLWANSIKDQGIFEPGEIKEALDAASAVGDDNIQKTVNGTVNPETWTHGSSQQRVAAFNKGYTTGTFASCQPFQG
ncbi:MAG: neutral zinc metallopeptidase [Candidatus Paceibacterota bacterium]